MTEVFEELYQTVLSRKSAKEEGSYTCYLFEKGIDKILKKCGEECTEMVIAAKNADNDELKNEIADLLYHIMVMCVERELEWKDVEEILSQRSSKTGNLKAFHKVDKNT